MGHTEYHTNERRQNNFTQEAYRDSMKRKGDSIGMKWFMEKTWLMQLFSHQECSDIP